MSNIKIHKQAGFTLVEIAIVLVIIGLLLGGILKGQELINSARVRNMADQNASVQAAYYGFIDRYRAVPGDMKADDACAAIGDNNLAGCNSGKGQFGGDGNGRVDADDYAEGSALWTHLSGANFIVGSYQGGAASGTYNVGTHAPANAFGSPVLLWRTKKYLSQGTAAERLGFIAGRLTPVRVASELDTKLDDGKPDAGVLRATNGASSTTSTEADGQDGSCTTGGATGEGNTVTSSKSWNLSTESQDCNAIYLY